MGILQLDNNIFSSVCGVGSLSVLLNWDAKRWKWPNHPQLKPTMDPFATGPVS